MASAEGMVVYAGLDAETERNAGAGYGIYVKVEHNKSEYTLYAHLSSVAVTQGEMVQIGQLIGASGNTGRSTGPHLHWEYRVNNTYADPLPLMVEQIPGVLFRATVTEDGDGLRLRTGPGTDRGIIRTLEAGEVVDVVQFTGEGIWLRTAEGYFMYKPEWVQLK